MWFSAEAPATFLDGLAIVVALLAVAGSIAATVWSAVGITRALRAKARARVILARLPNEDMRRLARRIALGEASDDDRARLRAEIERATADMPPRDRAFLRQGLQQSRASDMGRFAGSLLGDPLDRVGA